MEGSKDEVENIGKILKQNEWLITLLENGDASEENILNFENDNSRGILHIATHGFSFPEQIEYLDSNRLITDFLTTTDPGRRIYFNLGFNI